MSAEFSLQEIVAATGARHTGPAIDAFRGVTSDSRQVSAQSLFVAIAGERFDGHDFVAQAAKAGARGAVVRRGRRLSTR